MKREQLEALCGDPSRPTIGKPFSVQLDGRWWNGATNGHAMVIVETMSPDFVRSDTPPVSYLFRKRKKPTHTTDIGALSDWLEACQMWENCKGCHGTGSRNCDCYFCEIVEGDPCPVCDGDKGNWAQLPVRFGSTQFNRTLLARYLSPFRDSGIAKAFFGKGDLDPFEIQGDNWRVLTMPMRRLGVDKEETLPSSLMEPV